MRGDWFGRVVIGCVVLICVALVGLLIFIIVDRIGGTVETDNGYVVGKKFVEGECTTTIQYSAATETSSPVTTCTSDEWTVFVEVPAFEDNEQHGVSVRPDTYNAAYPEQKVVVTYTVGGMSGDRYLTSIELK